MIQTAQGSSRWAGRRLWDWYSFRNQVEPPTARLRTGQGRSIGSRYSLWQDGLAGQRERATIARIAKRHTNRGRVLRIMKARLLLILMFLLPQMWLSAAMAGQTPRDCQMPCCPIVVKTTSCCGQTEQVVIQHYDSIACVCRADANRDREPLPMPAPRSSWRVDVPVLTLVRTLPVEDHSLGPAVARSRTQHDRPRSHNVVQALVGVWLI